MVFLIPFIFYHEKDLIADNDITTTIKSQTHQLTSEGKSLSASHIKSKKHWCVIDWDHSFRTTRDEFDHFPHSLEVLLPCWTYFRKQDATANCGLVLLGRKKLGNWQTEFVKNGMECDVKFLDNKPHAKFDKFGQITNGKDIGLPEGIYHIPNLYLQRPRFGHIHYMDDRLDAHALRRKFVSDHYIEQFKGADKALQIGIIQRPKGASRRIGNVKEIRSALLKNFPGANVTLTDFSFPTVKEQAKWFATKNIVIAAHGAALANSIFITQGTIVLIIYPPGGFFQSLEPLIEQSGGVALDWYEKGEDPYLATKLGSRNSYNQAMHGTQEILPPVEDLVSRLRYASLTIPTWHELDKLFGPKPFLW